MDFYRVPVSTINKQERRRTSRRSANLARIAIPAQPSKAPPTPISFDLPNLLPLSVSETTFIDEHEEGAQSSSFEISIDAALDEMHYDQTGEAEAEDKPFDTTCEDREDSPVPFDMILSFMLQMDEQEECDGNVCSSPRNAPARSSSE